MVQGSGKGVRKFKSVTTADGKKVVMKAVIMKLVLENKDGLTQEQIEAKYNLRSEEKAVISFEAVE